MSKRIIVIDLDIAQSAIRKRCCIEGCNEPYVSFGYCKGHFKTIIDYRILMNAVVSNDTNVILKAVNIPTQPEYIETEHLDRLLNAESELDELLDPKYLSRKKKSRELAEQHDREEEAQKGVGRGRYKRNWEHPLKGKAVMDRDPRKPETEPRAPMRELQKPEDRKIRREAVNDSEVVQMYKMWESGIGQKEIGLKFDASPATVSRAMKYYREELFPPAKRKYVKKDKAEKAD